MVIPSNIRHHFPSINRYLGVMRTASNPEGFVNAVSEYLASWPKQKIKRLQRDDGGWGPFDVYGRSTQLRTVADVTRVGDAVRGQLVALKEIGVEPYPELVELDLFFFIAKQVAQDRRAS